ncbi:hypothetical protein ACFQZR_25730 [Paenibacillus sp. GCM10027629]
MGNSLGPCFFFGYTRKLQPQEARTINTHVVRYPSDHAAMMVEFEIQ